jgi:prevent-host-death family protein
MAAEPISVSARELSRQAASVLDRVENGERLIVTRDGEPIAEIIPIDRTQRLIARWVREGLLTEATAPSATKAATVARAARQSWVDGCDVPSATEALLQMREDERP